jgi:uncharacterized protein YgiM (DUF1202 family)
MNGSAFPAFRRVSAAMIRRLAVLLLLASGIAFCTTADTAAIRADRVNVMATPSQDGEILAWLKRGETVETLGPAGNGWVQIVLPPKVAVWAYGPLIDSASRRVRSKELNLRTGPGKNYVEIGKLRQGDIVTVIRESDGWLQIEPPAGMSGFIAASLVRITETATETTVTATPKEVPPPKTTQVAVPAEQIRAVSKNSQSTVVGTPALSTTSVTSAPKRQASVPPSPVPAPTFFTTPPAQLSVEASQPLIRYSDAVRVVVRVGRVGLSLDPKSPSYFELESLNRGEGSLGYLISDDEAIKVGPFRDRIVRVTAEEYVDPKRPTKTVLLVKSIRDDSGL